MIRRFGTALQLLLVAGDAVVASAMLVLLSEVRFGQDWESAWAALLPNPVVYAGLFAVAWVAILAVNGLYQLRTRWTIRSEVVGVLRSTLWIALATLASLFILRLPDVSRLFLVTLFASLAVLTVTTRVIVRMGFHAVRNRGRNLRSMLVIGTGDAGRSFAQTIGNHPELGYQIVGFLGERAELGDKWDVLGPVDRLPDVMRERFIDEVAICLPIERWSLVEDIAGFCRREGKIVRLPLTALDQPATSRYVEEIDGTYVVSLVAGPDRMVGLALKRALDILGAAVGLVILAPVFAAAGVAIALTDGRPVFFRQVRAGLNGRLFEIVKFRTMERGADARRAELRSRNEVKGNASFKMANDPRVTSIGRLLRRTSIDELPQLWNVLRGEMSLVGPRPHPLDDVAGYDQWHRRRLSMKPGITGLWQIGARREVDFDRWVEKDLEYIDHWSLWMDIRVILMTIPALLRAEGR